MRRKSNFAPSDSEEREDERCVGLHSNDMVEKKCVFLHARLCENACVCVDGRPLACLLFDIPGTLNLQFLYSGKCFLQNCFIPLQAHIMHESVGWVQF